MGNSTKATRLSLKVKLPLDHFAIEEERVCPHCGEVVIRKWYDTRGFKDSHALEDLTKKKEV